VFVLLYYFLFLFYSAATEQDSDARFTYIGDNTTTSDLVPQATVPSPGFISSHHSLPASPPILAE
jgi:hypothetical protein